MKKRGDRKDARLVRDIDPFHSFMVHLMPRRTDAEVFMHIEADATALTAYLHARNQNLGETRFKATLFHAVVAATAKVIRMRPLLNRYISGRRFFERDQITLSFVAKKQFSDHAEEALMILRPDDGFTLGDYTQKIVGEVREARGGGDAYGADGALTLLQKLPVWLNRLVMFFLLRLDEHGRVPASLYTVDPNQTTVLLSNLGSIRCDAVYHHLNNYGSNSVIITIGEIKRQYAPDESGAVRGRDILPLGITVDERIADGFYFARSIKLLQHILAHPELLEAPLGEMFAYEI